VAADVGAQIADGSDTIFGVMVESFLVDGNQDHTRTDELVHGQSITDKCLSWDRTEPLLHDLADAVRKRRS
jgi:3-deoxy-7-phosphoheptulonate synthase